MSALALQYTLRAMLLRRHWPTTSRKAIRMNVRLLRKARADA
jgi:hypothetical protein